MAKRAYVSQFYAEDKDIYDLLISQRRGLNILQLVRLARERGVYLSELDSREEIVRYLSRLSWDWKQLARLFELTNTQDRQEKTTSSVVSTTASVDEVERLVRDFEKDYADVRGEVFSVRRVGKDLVVNVSYTELDPTKARLSQRRAKELELRVEPCAGGLKFRHEANEHAEQIVAELVDELVAVRAETKRRVVELSAVKDPLLRTNFFLKLMNGVAAYKLCDVTSVSVDRVPVDDRVGGRPIDDGDDDDDDDDAFGHANAARKEAVEMMGIVKSVFLKGQTLLLSPEYKQLHAGGFFISQVVWIAERISGNGTGTRVEYEAEFNDGPNARDFRYGLRGIYKVKKGGEVRKTREAAAAEERSALTLLLETAAQEALAAVEIEATQPLPQALGFQSGEVPLPLAADPGASE